MLSPETYRASTIEASINLIIHRHCTGWALFITCTFVALVLSGCLTFPTNSTSGPDTVRAPGGSTPSLIDRVIASSKEHLGKPYRFRNEHGRAMDCGGFISYVWSLHGVTLPASSLLIAQQVERLPLEEAQKGDLLFFKGRRTFTNRVGHVSMIVGRKDDRIQMIHSCSSGVVIDDYPTAYYSKRFLFAGRIAGLPRDAMAASVDSTSPEPVCRPSKGSGGPFS